MSKNANVDKIACLKFILVLSTIGVVNLLVLNATRNTKENTENH